MGLWRSRRKHSPSECAGWVTVAVSFLDFEQPIAELEARLEELAHLTPDGAVNVEEDYHEEDSSASKPSAGAGTGRGAPVVPRATTSKPSGNT